MPVFRKVNVSFWQDPFVLNLTPEEKYFYLYLMTNTKTSQCGIYEIPKKIIEMETGYNTETIDKLIKRFTDYKKVIYSEETNEIMLVNWIKYNGSSSPKVLTKVVNELNGVKNKDLVKEYVRLSELNGYSLDSVSIQYRYGIDTKSQKEEEEEKEREKEKEVEEEQSATAETKNVFRVFEENIHLPTTIEIEKIKSWLDTFDEDVIIMAIEEAVNRNARNMAYINAILNNWYSNNLKTKDNVIAFKRDRADKNNSKNSKTITKNKSSSKLEMDHNYDMDQIEKQLVNRNRGG